MSTIIRTEKRVRSLFGQIVKWIFIAFNVLMLVWLVGGMVAVWQLPAHSDVQRVGHAIGAALAFSGIITIWAIGDIVLGLFVLLTRGNTVIVEESGHRTGGSDQASTEGSMDADAMIARYLQRQQSGPASQNRIPSAPAVFGRRR